MVQGDGEAEFTGGIGMERMERRQMENIFAMSDHVKALIALADTKATGSVYQNIGELTKNEISMVKKLLAESVPSFPLLYFALIYHL